MAFARLLAQLIKLRAHFPDYPIKKIRLDNVGEFTSQTFNDYCMSIGISVENPVPHVYTQNGLAESLIKRLQMIARPMIMKSKLPVTAWGHAILHAATLIRIRPTSYHTSSPLKLVFGHEPNVSHLRIFGCAVYVPIAPPQRTKMGPQRRRSIYGSFVACHFDESTFPKLGGDEKQPKGDICLNELSLSHLDPRTKQCELEVQRIIHLQRLENQLPDAFTDLKRVTKSHIPDTNAPIKISVPEGPLHIGNGSNARLKRGRPIGSKDKNPRKKKGANNKHSQIEVEVIQEKESPKKTLDMMVQDEHKVPENKEISINYIMSRKVWNRSQVEVDEIFSYNVALKIMENNEDHEPVSVDECKQRHDWTKWKDAIEAELNSLTKREVFGPIVQTPEGVKPVGYKWVFVRKRNDKYEITLYKARSVA
ncbi:uncharacterized protein LOC143626771 [Bidens hawaiensis]|uniref:uncharacterized protein LOC143626771 n=1 Tax=Bidens hawaiensis TaxID=980011 RepID=UPI00404ADA07